MDLGSGPIRQQTTEAYLQTHNLSKVVFRLSDERYFSGYVNSIRVAFMHVAATCFQATTYEGRRKIVEVS